MVQARVPWVDTLKFLGMFAIYLGHMGEASGYFLDYVFSYHIHLFFFAAGFFALKHGDATFGSVCLRKAKAIYLPYLFFAVLSVAALGAWYNAPATYCADWLIQILVADRQNMPVAPLWFFPCLFIIAVAYDALRRLFRGNQALIIGVGLVLSVGTFVLNQGTMVLPLTLDSASAYLVYYAVGAWAFPHICTLFGHIEEACATLRTGATGEGAARARRTVRLAFVVALALTAYTVLVFFGKDIVFNQLNEARSLFCIPLRLYMTFQTLGLIAFWVMVAKLLENVPVFQRLGQETLYLCGNEAVLKLVIPGLVGALGLNLTFTGPLTCMVYVAALMALELVALIPVEKRIYGAIGGGCGTVLLAFKR